MTPRPLLLVGAGGLAREVLAASDSSRASGNRSVLWTTTRASTAPTSTVCRCSEARRWPVN